MDTERFQIVASTYDLTQAPSASEYADYIEFRMDLVDNPLEEIQRYSGPLPLIVTNRIQDEGGKATSGTQRLEDLIAASKYDIVLAVDIELATVKAGNGDEVLRAVDQQNIDTIISSHNLETTPSKSVMKNLLRSACEYGTIGKLAVTPETKTDILDLLAVTESLNQRRIATIGMGEIGRISRIIAPYFGSDMGYAPIRQESNTAPGQYELSRFYRLLETI
ncbi:MAG: type I 3-dehydroquinate dehydratase [Halobacteriaceae archaeon]